MILYCESDAPLAPIAWSARAAEIGQEAADAERLATISHVVRNGNAPRIGAPGAHVAADLTQPLTVASEPDQHGGTLVTQGGELLRCPECLAPVRWLP